MSNIPGGRPRASSDGDILDDGLCNTFFANEVHCGVNAYRGNGSTLDQRHDRSYNYSSHSCLETDDFFDSDGEISSHSHNSSSTSKTNKSIFSFKSVKKAVSRRFARDQHSKFPPSTRKADRKLLKTPDLSKIWTPDLRLLGLSYLSVSNGKESAIEHSTMSTARPLITDPNVSMTVPKWKRTPGVIGIYNHGNSCFMNAVLQCLSNTDSFTEYFVKDLYKNDLKNSKNGKKSVFRSSQGEVTEQLGLLLKSIWSGKYNSDVSREFKIVVGKFSSQYKGDHQHDAQEFLLWLLDRIHEDVCTYLKKKLKPVKSPAPAKSDEDAASEAASVNGESFVVRLFQALHASTLTCPTCKRRSSTFDPYLCVSLPLPQRCPRQLSVVLVPYESSGRGGQGERASAAPRPGSLRVALTLNQYETVGELKVKLCSEVTEIDLRAKELILVQLREDGFGSTYSNEQPVSDIGEGESLYAVEAAFSSDTGGMNGSTEEEASADVNRGLIGGDEFDTPMAQVMVAHVEVSPGSNRSYRFGSPAMLKVRRDITWKGLQKEILHKMGDAVYEGVLSQNYQKLSAVFKLRVYDGSSRRNSLSSDIEMPLYTQDVERAFETLDEDFGPLHIKLLAEWDYDNMKKIVAHSREYVKVHRSVHTAHIDTPGQSRVSLDECFRLYTQEEKLSGEDAWVCPHCKQQQQGTIKTLGLWSLPDILVLHLKRFKQTGLRRSKLNTLVDFPKEGLDMSPYLARHKKGVGSSSPIESNSACPLLRRDDHTYDLLGVSNHYGSMMGGHYKAVCKSPVDGVWREFNDQSVRPLDEDEPIATKEAYLLFYQRKSLGKDINQSLFTGDHWAFSLSLAPSELREEGSSSGGSTPRGELLPSMPPLNHISSHHPRQRSLPRSVSPSFHKHSTREHVSSGTGANSRRSVSSSRPLTPQPHRKPITPYKENRSSDGENDYHIDRSPSSPTRASSPPVKNTTTRRSRPVQRQVSEPGPRLRKPLASAQTDTFRDEDPHATYVLDRHSHHDEERELDPISNGRLGRKSYETATAKSRITTKDNGPPKATTVRNESQGLSDIASDGKYHSLYERSNYSDHSNSQITSLKPLRVNLEDRDFSERASHSLPPYTVSETMNAASARRRLAGHIDLGRIEDPPLHSLDFTNRDSYTGQNSRKYDSHKSYELAKKNLLRLNSDLSDLRFLSGEQYSSHHPSLDLDKSEAEDQGRWEKTSSDSLGNNKYLNSNGYSRLDSDVEEEDEGEEGAEPVPRRSLQTQLQGKYHTVAVLAEKHFGPRPYKKEKYVPLPAKNELPSTSSDQTQLPKYVTIGRTRLPDRELPRSSTDYSIQYSLAHTDLQAPPSPTPPRGLGEERILEHGVDNVPISSSFTYTPSYAFSSHPVGRLTNREIQALHTFEYAGRRGRRSDGAQTLPGYTSDSSIRESRHNFRPPRGTWGIYTPKVKESHPSTTIATPCLRESSV